ncbi:hypothetical protein N8310_08595 [Pseudomonadota bacterium]|nr:hypothetical protein [Alphaproteobacteria bacterium]MDC1357631.1 hypothetical protein [Pseudomonadota bacterium]
MLLKYNNEINLLIKINKAFKTLLEVFHIYPTCRDRMKAAEHSKECFVVSNARLELNQL